MANLSKSGFVGFMDFRNGTLQTRWRGLAASAFLPYCLAWAASPRQRRNDLFYSFSGISPPHPKKLSTYLTD
jgi:hypothetical protein